MYKTRLISGLSFALALILTPTLPSLAFGADEVEEVVAVGSRREARSVGDSAAPVDIISGSDFVNQGAADLSDMIRTMVPSFNVNTQPISDAATLIRPPNLRGLPPDDMLVLVNGKRRHRGAVISFLGGGVADGAQGVDLQAIPSIALKQVEVLRDGAAAQYGSDAIAGVMNFVYRDNAEGVQVEVRSGEFTEGDGDMWRIAANVGMPFTDNGFANFSVELQDSDATSRSVQRADAQALFDGGNKSIWNSPNPAQIWGQPAVSDDIKLVANIGLELDDSKEFYLFGNYAERKVLGGFYFRNPTNRGGIFSADGGTTRLVGDVAEAAGGTRTCPVVAVPATGAGSSSDTALTAIKANPNCFVFNEVFPGGFTPSFGGSVSDWSIASGVKGNTESGTLYDVSVSVGENQADYYIENTLNGSLGPNSPTSFNPGSYVQLEKNFNADFSKGFPVEGFASDLNVAWGLEFREEQFTVISGNEESWEIGPYFNQGFGIGSNGFGGFSPSMAGTWDRSNLGLYVDLEADVSEKLLLGLAVRYEDFDTFGSTSNNKVSGLYRINDRVSLRGTMSTGFRAPTPGQANIANISTVSSLDGVLFQRGTLAPTNPVSVYYGGKELTPEESESTTLGLVWDVTDSFNVTIDAYEIELTDRITQGDEISVTPADIATLQGLGVPGAGDLTTFKFYVNDFDTTTKGFDVVATYSAEMGNGTTDLTFVYSDVDTTVDRTKKGLIGATSILRLEDSLPGSRWNLSAVHNVGDWRLLARINDMDGFWVESSGMVGGMSTVDLEITRDLGVYSLTLGAQNAFDEYPGEEAQYLQDAIGMLYPEAAPLGFQGAFYYFKLGMDF
ncbi:TonB-dependent receptor [bacterium]|nr:TonB-dependent receptor [bacterium]